MNPKLPNILCLAAILFCLGGCLAIQRDADLRQGDKVLDGETMELLHESRITKTWIIDSLGDPLVQTRDGSVYMYLFVRREGVMDIHLLNPISIPFVVAGALQGVAITQDELPVYQKHTEEIIRKDILLIEFDKYNYAVRIGVYKFPQKIPPSMIVEDWLGEPLPAYLELVE